MKAALLAILALSIMPAAGARMMAADRGVDDSGSWGSPESGNCCAGGGAAETVYGSASYATAKASWSYQDSQGQYHNMAYAPSCGGSYSRCLASEGCEGTCPGYWEETTAMIGGNPDAQACVGSPC